MRDPSPDLVAQVRRVARRFGVARGVRACNLGDLEGDALEWLCRYEPPPGWNVEAAVHTKLPWALLDIARLRARQLRRQPFPHGLPNIVDQDDSTPEWRPDRPEHAFDGHLATDELGFGEVDLELLLDAIEDPDERRALIAVATVGDAPELARREGVDQSTIHHRARRARAHVLAALEEPACASQP